MITLAILTGFVGGLLFALFAYVVDRQIAEQRALGLPWWKWGAR